jgi:DNA-binding transcriptional regulator YhcF (GntR family)
MLDIKLKDLSAGPVYLQVRQQLEALISAGSLAAGDSLPAPARLAQQLSVDRGEIQRAYFELERSGLVRKSARKDFLTGKEIVSYTVA